MGDCQHPASGIARPLGLVLFLGALLALPPSAHAHPDFRIVDQTVTIAAGSYGAFPLSVHYHRLVGTYQVVSPLPATVSALVMDDPAFSSYAAKRPASILYATEKASAGRLNFLIPCCTGEFFTSPYTGNYTSYHLVVENGDSSGAVTVRLRADLIHDGMAVIAYGSEPFAAVATAGFSGAFAALMPFFMRRALRPAWGSSPSPRQLPRQALLLAAASLALGGSIVGFNLLLALAASAAYGGGLVDGQMAAQAMIPELPGPLRLLGENYGILWLLGAMLWLRAFVLAAPVGSNLVGAVGVLAGLVPVVLGSLVGFSYGSLVIPVLLGIFGLPQVAGGLYLSRRAGKSPPDFALPA